MGQGDSFFDPQQIISYYGQAGKYSKPAQTPKQRTTQQQGVNNRAGGGTADSPAQGFKLGATMDRFRTPDFVPAGGAMASSNPNINGVQDPTGFSTAARAAVMSPNTGESAPQPPPVDRQPAPAATQPAASPAGAQPAWMTQPGGRPRSVVPGGDIANENDKEADPYMLRLREALGESLGDPHELAKQQWDQHHTKMDRVLGFLQGLGHGGVISGIQGARGIPQQQAYQQQIQQQQAGRQSQILNLLKVESDINEDRNKRQDLGIRGQEATTHAGQLVEDTRHHNLEHQDKGAELDYKDRALRADNERNAATNRANLLSHLPQFQLNGTPIPQQMRSDAGLGSDYALPPPRIKYDQVVGRNSTQLINPYDYNEPAHTVAGSTGHGMTGGTGGSGKSNAVGVTQGVASRQLSQELIKRKAAEFRQQAASEVTASGGSGFPTYSSTNSKFGSVSVGTSNGPAVNIGGDAVEARARELAEDYYKDHPEELNDQMMQYQEDVATAKHKQIVKPAVRNVKK